MKSIGVLWDKEVSWDGDTPFEDCSNETYEYFSGLAEDEDVLIYTAKYQWYDNGVLEKAWFFDGEWQKVKGIEVDGIYDKFHYGPETVDLKKEIAEELGLLNHPDLEELCKDKLLTCRRFPEWVPETREASDENIEEMLDDYGKVVLKPRYDYGGAGIHIIDAEEVIPDFKDDYIVQRFIDSSSGFKDLVTGYHDVRGIIVNGKLLSSYLRYNSDSEISNVQQGGTKKAISVSEFPEEAQNIVDDISSGLEFEPALFSVDFFFDQNDQPWIVELNSKPGLTIYNDKMKEEITPVMRELITGFKQL